MTPQLCIAALSIVIRAALLADALPALPPWQITPVRVLQQRGACECCPCRYAARRRVCCPSTTEAARYSSGRVMRLLVQPGYRSTLNARDKVGGARTAGAAAAF
jgi:hypothetical protein